MTISLRPSVQETCAEEIGKAENRANCNVFLKSVCDRQMIFLSASMVGTKDTGQAGTANDLLQGFFDYSLRLSSLFSYLGRGLEGELHGTAFARAGKLVVCGLSAAELNSEASRIRENKKTLHGHVAVLSGNFASNRWPEAYWGMHGSPELAGRPASLSKCFRAGDRNNIAYYGYA